MSERKTHCLYGHQMEAPNLYFDSRGSRRCLACLNRSRKHQAEKRAGSREYSEAEKLRKRAYFLEHRAYLLLRQKERRQEKKRNPVGWVNPNLEIAAEVFEPRTGRVVRRIDISRMSPEEKLALEQELARTIDLDTQEVRFIQADPSNRTTTQEVKNACTA